MHPRAGHRAPKTGVATIPDNKISKRTRNTMKQKTHKGTAKRIKVTGAGKLRREQANRRHLLEGKPSTRTRRLKGTTDVAKADEKRIKRLLGKA